MWQSIKDVGNDIVGVGNLITSTRTITEAARQVGSSVSFDESVETLKRKCEDLGFRAEDVKTEVENAESSSGAKRRKTVGNWLGKVENLRNEVDGIDAALSQSGILERPQLASKVKNLTEQAEELLKQGELHQGLTLNTPHEGGVELPTKPLVGQAFEENHEKIWEYLMEPDVLTIGVWGMGGVGKTTLVTHINNRAREQLDTFGDVCWVTVSQNMDILKLQDKLAKAAHLEFNGEGEMERAAMLYNKLKKKRCLVILDDVWQGIDFHKVGIPVKVNCCKVIITTRSLNVCNRMDCHQTIKVEILSEEEAWDLFQKNLGSQVKALSEEVYKVALPVARECAGLPLGIITVARCMRGVDDAREWRCALKALRESKHGLVEMEEEVFHVLKFSYNRLRDPKVQQSFLYCALYPEDHEIYREELVQRLIDEEIIEAKGSRQDQLDSGHTILNELVRSSLLQECVRYSNDHVKMHDLLRDMAINMKSIEFMVKSGMQLEELPGTQEWSEHVERVSLMYNQIKEVAIATGTSPRCPKLSTLLLSRNGSLNRIDNSFFLHMPALRMLDLSDCAPIKELPDSVSGLKNLIALVLNGCYNLRKLPSLAELELMKRLDLHGTHITEVPHGLEKLVRLTYLDISSSNMKVFPTGILPQLLLLEFLQFNADLKIKEEELQMLERLSTFKGKVTFDDVSVFKSYVMSMGTHNGPNSSYQFELNDRGKFVYEGTIRKDELNRVISVELLNMYRTAREDAIMDVETIEALLKDVKTLGLHELYGARNLCDMSLLNNVTHDLKEFELWGCRSVQCLVPYWSSSLYFLPNLEELSLCHLTDLEVLFELGRGEYGPMSPLPAVVGGAFSCLKVLELSNCNKIKMLFHPSFLPNLGNLQQIYVLDCDALQEIVAKTISGGETSTSIELEFALPNLRTLTLKRLPELKSICAQTISCPSLCEIIVEDCPQLKRMPLFVCPSSFESISVCPYEWWESSEWDLPNAKELLEPYLIVTVGLGF